MALFLAVVVALFVVPAPAALAPAGARRGRALQTLVVIGGFAPTPPATPPLPSGVSAQWLEGHSDPHRIRAGPPTSPFATAPAAPPPERRT